MNIYRRELRSRFMIIVVLCSVFIVLASLSSCGIYKLIISLSMNSLGLWDSWYSVYSLKKGPPITILLSISIICTFHPKPDIHFWMITSAKHEGYWVPNVIHHVHNIREERFQRYKTSGMNPSRCFALVIISSSVYTELKYSVLLALGMGLGCLTCVSVLSNN